MVARSLPRDLRRALQAAARITEAIELASRSLGEAAAEGGTLTHNLVTALPPVLSRSLRVLAMSA